MHRVTGTLVSVVCVTAFLGTFCLGNSAWADDAPVSYHGQIRPLIQAHCQGCHQPAKASGDYIMTAFDGLLSGGESDSPAVVPGKPDESYLLELITPEDGSAEMPQDGEPLSAEQVALVRRWITEGAKNDTPAGVQQQYDADHPPQYELPPVVTAMDCSPDGKWLAVSGFHEVLLHGADGAGVAARLIGMSERIESVAFSPDGQRLAVTGGLPGRVGELQIWDLSGAGQPKWQPRLVQSIPVTYDTIYGGAWSPDGEVVAIGCGDKSVRAFHVKSGKQVLFQGAHGDWALDTVFSVDGKNLISVSRDGTAKLTEVATERFVDNITSITPGALKGGISSVVRHPKRDEIVIGGADGVPKIYRVFRLTARRIGDDANLIRRMPPMKGRVFSVAISRDGRRIAAGSSLNGSGQVDIDAYEFDTSLPEDVKKIMSKVSTTRSAAERKRLEQYQTDGVKRIASLEMTTGIYSVAFHPSGKHVYAAGADGVIRMIETETGEVSLRFPVVSVSEVHHGKTDLTTSSTRVSRALPLAPEQLPEGAKVAKLESVPREVKLNDPYQYVQLLVSATLTTGETIDVTRMVKFNWDQPVAEISRQGTIRALTDGQTSLQLSLDGQSLTVPVSVAAYDAEYEPDFRRDVAPVVARLGCNQGTCHGAAKGKNGFKLSLRGYDPIVDVRAFTDDHGSRRANIASPDDSLMLLKATGAVPHVGGQLTRPGEDYYQIIRDWLGHGAKLPSDKPPVVAIDIAPKNPIIQKIGSRQQFRIVARYADGRVRDVTHEAFVTSGNSEVAAAQPSGLIASLRRGEAPILARYEGAYTATTLTVMGDRTGFDWQAPAGGRRIDQLVAAKWQRLKIQPSELCSDAEFIRRVSLDLTGLPPTADTVRKFLADSADSTSKRAKLIESLIGSDAFVDYWTNKWSDLLSVNRKFLGPDGATGFHSWIRRQVAANRPYDEFVSEIVTATGSNREHPAASYFKTLRTPQDVMETTTQLFLAVRFSCNKCHDHPFERWTQDQYYHTAAYFARVGRKADPAAKGRKIGGTAVEGAKPLFEIIEDGAAGEMIHDRTKEVAAPEFPFSCDFKAPDHATRRQQLAAWLTSPDNPYFARSYVNRLWAYLLGTGIIEPIDDIRAGNPPTNPELLDYLAQEFIESGFNVRHVINLICQSRTYQLSIVTNRWNSDDATNFSHAKARRLPAEVLFDALHAVTGATSKIPGVPAGTRAVQLADAGIKLPSGFLSTLGRPSRESPCECERSNDIQLTSVMAMISGPIVSNVLADPANALSKLVEEQPDDNQLVQELFLRVLNRPATDDEVSTALAVLQEIDEDHEQLELRRKQSEQTWVARKKELEASRLESLEKARQDLQAYTARIAPKVATLEQARKKKILEAEQQVKQYESKLPEAALAWSAKQKTDREWFPLRASQATASNGARLTARDDRSIVASGKAEKGVYTITFETSLSPITHVRLETLPLAGIKGGGPGLPPNGNFVVTEFELTAAPATKEAKFAPVGLQQPTADFTQTGFEIAQAIDGVTNDQRGWATAPAGGIVHWATFQTKKPINFDSGVRLQLKIHQYHNAADHRLARFRVSVATDEGKPALSLPESLDAVVSTPAKQRSDAQLKTLTDYFRGVDASFSKLQAAVADAKRPVPIDGGISSRNATVAQLEKPTPDDPVLVQLRADVEQSRRQLKARRLTAAQDLTWALINSPAFLFNH